MSTIYVDNVAGQGGGTATNLMNGLAKAVWHYVQTTQTTSRSDNVSSITDVSTGRVKVDFNNAFDAADQAVGSWWKTSVTNVGGMAANSSITGLATTDWETFTVDNTGTVRDASINCGAAFGDLA